MTHSKNAMSTWLDWFDDVLLSIDNQKIVIAEYVNDFGEKGQNRLLPIKIRENLYSYIYLIGIELNDDNSIDHNFQYKDLVIINLNNITNLTKTNKFVSNVSFDSDRSKFKRKYDVFMELISERMDIILNSFVGVLPPEPQHHHYENPTVFDVDVHLFQLPFFKRYKIEYDITDSPKGQDYKRVRFKTNPSFEFIKQVLMLNDNWNYDRYYKGKRMSEITSVEVVDNNSPVNKWMREYIKQNYRRALLSYEDNPIIQNELIKEIKQWEISQNNPSTKIIFPLLADK
ncbi:hypothetical protein [Flammeovirga pacifica]|nr:hypothetical protein [Flammeovirga pacifica]